ncbi:MAG: bifunctional DNA-formamidopyrimidine glycosylase/DNA-(apurinic or apyrimidinic site) lyase [Acidimicrobiia bacterium]|jgi:formamidopyrimidine-DNA glycosylase
MPELPEAEVVRRDLDAVVRGRTVVAVEVGRDRAVRREPSIDGFVDALTGRTVAGTGRVGKFLVVHLGGGDGRDAVVVHLGMSGQLRVAESAAQDRLPHTHVVWALDDGREVRFVDPRTFGQMWQAPTSEPGGRPLALGHLGPDALDDLTTASVLAPRLANRRVRLKLRLMDQTAVAGLGNIYTDEICFRAGISGARPAGSLADAEVERLVDATRAVLTDAIAARGSSLADAQYVDVHGRTGAFQHQHAVHARAGLPCPVCGTAITRERVGGRYAYQCGVCQT